jgi:hypothetical protein
MDPFSDLTDKLRLLILTSLGDTESAVTAARASPALLRAWTQNEDTLLAPLVSSLFPGDLLQDALAVLCFPRDEQAHLRKAVVDAHLRSWGHKQLRLDEKKHSHQLCVLHTRLWWLIKDYLAKATSLYLPRAYRYFPPGCHESFKGSLVSSGDRFLTPLQPFAEGSLSETSRRRILRAFLKYEILCKVYGPVVNTNRRENLSPESFHDQHRAEDSNQDSSPEELFVKWDWNLLDKYQSDRPDSASTDALSCVREYIITLYEGMISDYIRVTPAPRRLRAWECLRLPSRLGLGGIPSPWVVLPRLREAHVIVSRADDYWSPDMDGKWSSPDAMISLLASTGLNVLFHTLRCGQNELRRFYKHLAIEITECPPERNGTYPHSSRIGPPPEDADWHPYYIIRYYRQRAWALLDLEERSGPALPCPRMSSMDRETNSCTYELRPQQTFANACSPEPAEWNISLTTHPRREWICHGMGSIAYNALKGKMTAFWE